jgi:hypothetical protein
LLRIKNQIKFITAHIAKKMPDQSNTENNQTNIASIGPNDVLLGRGGATNNHGGNQKFRLFVAEHQREYLQARKHDKVVIARRIVSMVYANGGRFLQSGSSKDNWVQASDKRAQEKTSQALREGLDVRNNKLRPNKLIKAVRRNSESSSSQLTYQQSDAPSAVMKPTITTGKVVTPKSPTSKSAFAKPLQSHAMIRHNLYIPTFQAESSEPFFVPYQPPPVSKQELEYACEV